MLNYVLIKRLLGLVDIFIVSVVFYLSTCCPAIGAINCRPEADGLQVIELVRQQLEVGSAFISQFWHYISNAVQGFWPVDGVSRRPVAGKLPAALYANAVADHNQYGLGGRYFGMAELSPSGVTVGRID